jgi:hypothetical protein
MRHIGLDMVRCLYHMTLDTRNLWSLRFLDLAVTASITSIFCVTDVEVRE